MKNSFVRYKILGWQYFSFTTLNMTPTLWPSWVVTRNQLLILLRIPYIEENTASLLLLSRFSICLWFSMVWLWCVSVVDRSSSLQRLQDDFGLLSHRLPWNHPSPQHTAALEPHPQSASSSNNPRNQVHCPPPAAQTWFLPADLSLAWPVRVLDSHPDFTPKHRLAKAVPGCRILPCLWLHSTKYLEHNEKKES